jgi:hypothetical protein
MYGGNNPYPPQGYDQAGFNFGQQQNSYQQPPYQQQGSYYQQPGSQYQQPGSQYQQPGSQYQQPGSHYQQGPYSPYQQNPYPPQGYQQGPLNPNYNQHSAYDLPPTTQSSYPQNHRISLTFDRPTSSSYDPHNKRPLSFNGFDNRPNSYAQPPYNGPGEPYLAVPYNGNPYPPYNGPGEPYLAVQYNGNQPYQQQPYNMPMINSAPVYYQPPPQYFKDHKISDCHGNKKALLIGINYIGQMYQLKGCINDVKSIKQLIVNKFGFSEAPDKMVILTDDQKDPLMRPTRVNIINAMKWLVSGCKPGDSLFFHFSGHGSQKKDLDGDEVDGYDETILPVDYKKNGQIVDDEMNAIMVRPLPEGVRLTAIFDSCHSGTALDLPYIYGDDGKLVIQKGPSQFKMFTKTLSNIASGNVLGAISNVIDLAGSEKVKKNSEKAKKMTEETRSSFADVIMFSGCKDSQTSSDTKINNMATGAMSYALIKALSTNRELTYLQLLRETKKHLSNFKQKPQLSSGRLMDMNQKFIM